MKSLFPIPPKYKKKFLKSISAVAGQRMPLIFCYVSTVYCEFSAFTESKFVLEPYTREDESICEVTVKRELKRTELRPEYTTKYGVDT